MAIFSCRRSCEAMGTGFEAYLFGDDPEHLEAVAVAALEEIRRLDRTLSRFNPTSEIARINREAAEQPVRVDREVFALLEMCEQARLETGGYFDVTASRRDVETAGGIVLDPDVCSVRLSPSGARIDLGGVGKGYALDRARDLLTNFGIEKGMLNGGSSSMLALGAYRDGGGWPVDVRHPIKAEAPPITRIELRDRALSCSAVRGDYQEGSDLLNPWTGQPLNGDAACVVLSASATEAEIYSTAFLAMGVGKAIEILNQNSMLDVGWFSESEGFDWIRNLKLTEASTSGK